MREVGDPHRLPATVHPSAYRLRLEPFLETASFTGTVEIDVDVTAPTDTIVLNAHQLEIGHTAATSVDLPTTLGTVTLDEESQRATLVFPSTLALGRTRCRCPSPACSTTSWPASTAPPSRTSMAPQASVRCW